jgi:hypothetical protein
MRSWLGLLSALALSVASLVSFPTGAQTALAVSNCSPISTFCYFHGVAGDQANKATIPGGTATFNDTAPTGTVPITQTTSPFANRDFVGNPLAAFWKGPFTGTVSGLLELKWFWSTTNAEATALGAEVQVSVFADPDFSAPNPVQPEKLIGRGFVVLTPINAVPKEFTSTVPVRGTVANTLLIQVVPRFVDTGQGLTTHYDATSTQSRFHFIPTPPPPAVTFDTTPVAFAPSTIVSAHFLGAEPQTTLERNVKGSLAGRLDPKRIFVDWPLTSRTQTSQLSRSTDGSDSFRLLFDPLCAARNRPNCLSGGGGDSENEVNLVNGNVFFLDQEGLVVNEGLGSSLDHGDTFPATRDHAVTNTAVGVDRQWLAWVDPFQLAAGISVEAFMSYHVPVLGQFIQAIDQTGTPLPQSVPQVLLVNQSGQMRVDNSGGPAHRWIYQPYRGGGGVTVATAFAPNYQNPLAWESNVVSSDTASIFPWLTIDSAGNAYMVWVAGGVTYLSIAPINDPRNNPATGRPGRFWTPKANVTLPGVNSTVFPEVTAGDSGRVAITYMGSEDCAPGPSDNCAAASHWNTYVGIIPDALALVRGTTMTVSTGKVNHRVVHRGNICTGGTGCTAPLDRSLLDMTDLGFDEAGRVGVVFMDNNNRLAAPTLTDGAKNGPFAEFAKNVLGPSLLATRPDIRVTIPQNARTDPAGDATWPNRSGAPNLPSLDLLGASISINGSGELVARLPLQEATRAGMARDLAAYNNAFLTDNNAERLQYIARFATADDVFHMSMEFNANGTVRFFGGRLDANDKVDNGTGATVGSRYVTDPGFTVTGTLGHGALTLRAPATQFGLGLGSQLFSVTGFATAAPSESNVTAGLVTNSARTVDATPPFDATLQQQAEPPSTVDCTDENITTFGGWHTLTDSRAGGGTICRNVGANKFKSGAYLSFQFRGASIDVIAAKGPRGGNFNISLDGAKPTKVDLFRPPTDPTHPDSTGRQDLTFGVNVLHRDTGPGTHTLRIDVLNDNPDPLRDMVYLDEFVIAAGDIVTPTSVGTADVATTVTGTLKAGAATVLTFAVDTGTRHVALVLEAGANVSMTLRDATGTVIDTAQASSGVVTIDVGPLSVGLATAVLSSDVDEAFEMWEVLTENR